MDKFKFEKTNIDGLYVIEPTIFGDHRGYFMETYNEKEFHKFLLETGPTYFDIIDDNMDIWISKQK